MAPVLLAPITNPASGKGSMTESLANPAPLVAIVTPVYNGAQFLEATMRSVQEQTYPNIVHVVLDNASTDATPQIVESFKNQRVPLVVARNDVLLQMDDNWNAALKLVPAEAAYFAFVCADDILMPESTERMVALAESDDEISMVTSNILRNGRFEDFRWPRDQSVFDGREAARMYLKLDSTFEGRQILMRREAILSATPFWDETVVQASDMDVALRMLGRGKLGFVHQPLMNILDHPDNEFHRTVLPTHLHYGSWFINLKRHGPKALGAEFVEIYKRYRRSYLRRMLIWVLKDKNRAAFDCHMQLLAKVDREPTAFQFLDAIVDWALIKIKLRKNWHGAPY